MKKFLELSLCMVLLLWASSAMATGLGPYFEYDYSSMSLSGFEDEGDLDIDVDVNHFIFGFNVDTCTSRDSLFNYRFNIGVDIASATIDDSDESISGYGFDMKHIFGFGILRNRIVRLWAGPAIGLYMDAYDFSDFGQDDNGYVVGGGGGPVIGVNFHIASWFSLGIMGGYMYNYSVFIPPGDADKGHGGENRFYVQIAPLFNVGSDRDAWSRPTSSSQTSPLPR